MHLFVSYARVDKPFCVQIVDTLDVHEVWYDQRLYAGEQWWSVILRRLDWCEGFIYLLSPDSVASEYCMKEYELARDLGKPIFPVLIHEKTSIPDSLLEYQYVNLCHGLTPEAVKVLLNSIYVAERNQHNQSTLKVDSIPSESVKPPAINSATVISAAATAMERGQFDQAVFLLKQAKANGFTSRFINLEAVLAEAEAALEQQAYLREAEREYKQIAELVRHQRTRRLGCEAFDAFRKDFADFDPDRLCDICADPEPERTTMVSAPVLLRARTTLPLLTWSEVPAGKVVMATNGAEPLMNGTNGVHVKTPELVHVEEFAMSKYPVTNAQYDVFLQDPEGYADPVWWDYSEHARQWRENNPQIRPARFSGETRPRETVSWFDAIAFSRWLSAQLGITVTLPTSLEWQRAARGDDNRAYPWGDVFDRNRCNTRESELKMTTMVMRYDESGSPFEVFDLAGNVWEWCLDGKLDGEHTLDITVEAERAMHGGSFMSYAQRARIPFNYYVKPQINHEAIGFRIIKKIT
jgi:formylglycine-generating enzyme required for sulfatase activity